MSESNGHAAADLSERLSHARDEYRLLRLERRIEEMRRDRTFTEAFGSASGWGIPIDPRERYNDPDFDYRGHGMVPGAGQDAYRDGGNQPFIFSQTDLQTSWDRARWLYAENDHAAGAILALRDLIIGTGFKYEAKPEKKMTNNPVAVALAEQVQSCIDRHHDLNMMDIREQEFFETSRVDGDAFLRHFCQPNGDTFVRSLLPEQIQPPAGDTSTEWSWGIQNLPGDVENIISYGVSYYGSTDWQEVDASEIVHYKCNVRSLVKRGMSDFYFSSKAFRQLVFLLECMRVGSSAQAAIPYIEKFTGATGSSVAALVAARRDQNQANGNVDPWSQRSINATRIVPGKVPLIGEGRDVMPSPTNPNTTQHISTVQVNLRSLACRWGLTEDIMSGDASNNNYASLLVAGGLPVRRAQCEQNRYRYPFLRSRWIAVRNAASVGRFVVNGRVFSFEEIQAMVDINVTPPQVAIGDELKDSQVDQADIAAHVISPQERARRRGVDPEVMAQEIAEWNRRFPPPATPAAPGFPGAPGGNGPAGSTGKCGDCGGKTLFPKRDAMESRLHELRERYGQNAAQVIVESATRITEGVAKNKTGPGCHDTQTGHPAKCDGGVDDKSGKDSSDSSETAKQPRVPEKQPSEKAERAKKHAKLVNKKIQRYAEEYNEPRFAKVVEGKAHPDSEPMDVTTKNGDLVELKTMVDNSNNKITMDSYSQIRKIVKEQETGKTFHTVVSDDSKIYDPVGDNHDESKGRTYYYRRGVAGSARVDGMYRCKDEAELKKLMAMPDDKLPAAAQRTDAKHRVGKWEFFEDDVGKGYRNSETGKVFRAKK